MQSALDADGNDNVTVICRKAHCRRCEPFNNAHVLAMTIVNHQIDHFVISAFNTIFTEHEIRRS